MIKIICDKCGYSEFFDRNHFKVPHGFSKLDIVDTKDDMKDSLDLCDDCRGKFFVMVNEFKGMVFDEELQEWRQPEGQNV